MFPIRFLVLPFILAMPATLASGDTLIGNALDALRTQKPLHADQFSFVLVGDTRGDEPVILPETFRNMIQEWNLLQPAFVIDVGDLILGGAAEGLEEQWRAFEDTVATSKAPFLPVVGNHDVSDAATEKIFEERIGPLTFAFTYGNSRFIVLNSEEQGMADTLSAEQIAWLDADLNSTRAENIFIFLHKPYFAGDWDKQWAPVARVFVGHPVRVVFGCHWHLYRDYGERDGVRYVVSGGGGANVTTPEEEGGFFHYLLVQIKGAEVSWVVMRPGNVLPPDVVTAKRVNEIHQLRAGIQTEPILAGYGAPIDREIVLKVANPYGHPLKSILEWSLPEGWWITPQRLSFHTAANTTGEYRFRLAVPDPARARFPVPSFKTAIQHTASGHPITVEQSCGFVPATTANYAVQPVTIDGGLGEWTNTPPLPLDYTYGFDGNPEDLKAQVRLQWDEGHLYMAIEAEDDEFYQPYGGDIVWSADNVQLMLDRYEWGLSLTPKGPEVFLYKGPEREQETVNTVVALAVHREGRRCVYEAAFPLSEVAPLKLQAGNTFRYTVIMNDLDPSVVKRGRHWLELTPGAGEGGSEFPRVAVTLGAKP